MGDTAPPKRLVGHQTPELGRTEYTQDEKEALASGSRDWEEASCKCESEMVTSRMNCARDFWGYQLIILVCSFLYYFIMCGICYTVSVYYVAWIDDFGAGSAITSWLGSVHLGVICGTGPISGLLTERFGFRPIVIVGGIIATAGIIATVFVQNIYSLLLTFSVITPFGMGLAFVPASTIVSLYFDRGRVLANGIFTSGAGFGNFVMSYTFQAGIEALSWRGSMFIVAGFALQLCVLGALMKEPESWLEIKRKRKLKLEDKAALFTHSGFHIYKNIDLVLYLIHMMLVAAGMSVVYVHVTAITESLGRVSRERATLAIALIALSNIFGRLFSGLLGQNENVDTFLFYIVSLTMSGLSAILVPFLSYYACIITWSVIFGLLNGPSVALMQIMILHFVDMSDLNYAFSHNCVFMAIGYMIGAPLAGWLYDHTHDYSGSFFLGGSFITLGSLLLIIPYVRHRKQRDCTSLKLTPELRATSFGSMIGSQYLTAKPHLDEGQYER